MTVLSTRASLSRSRFGLNTSSGSPSPPPWTPAQISNLSVYWDGIVGHGGVFKDNPPVTACANNDACETLKGLFGTTANAVQSTVGARPVATTDGITFTTDGSQSIVPVSDIVLDPSVGFTVVGIVDFVGDVALFGNQTNASGGLFGTISGAFYLATDTGETPNISPSSPFSGITGLWLNCNSAGAIMQSCTNSGGFTVNSITSITTLNQLGVATGLGINNGDATNGYQLWIVVQRNIPFNGVEAGQLKTYLAANYGGVSFQ